MWTFDSLALLHQKLKDRLDKLKISQIPNDAGFVTAAQAAAAAPVQSVNGLTGAVTAVPELGYLGANADFNSVIKGGMYRFDSGCTPTAGIDWGQLLVIRGRGDTCAQIVFPYMGGASWSAKMRWGYQVDGTSPVWEPWRTIRDSVNTIQSDNSVWVGSSYDLNNFHSGVVLCYSNVQNVPSADWWHIAASGTSGTIVQIATKLQNNGQVMTRRCAGGTWSAWEALKGWLPTSGGTMSGSIKFPNGTAMPHKSSPQFVITIDSFANGGEMGYATLSELSSQLVSYVNDVTVVSKSSKVTFVKKYYVQYGRVGQLTIGFHVTTALTNGETIATLSGIGRPWFGPTVTARASSGGSFLNIDSGYSGNNVTLKCSGAGPVDNWYGVTLTYITV